MMRNCSFVKTPKQREATNLHSQFQQVMSYGGSRSGKTAINLRNITVRALKAKSRHLVSRFRFNHVKQSIVYDTFPKVMKLAFPEVKYSLNKSDWFVELDNGSEIWFGGLDDPEQRQKAKIELMKQQQAGQLREMEVSLSAIVAEAKSRDKWTSRARPSFMYVMYILFLSAIPMGFLFAFNPEVAGAVTSGVRSWLDALPEELYWLFGTGYLGYSAARSYDKGKIK